jgi:hypothetical protein
MTDSLYKNRRPKAAPARISAALECTTASAIHPNDVDSFLAGVNVKLDEKREVKGPGPLVRKRETEAR